MLEDNEVDTFLEEEFQYTKVNENSKTVAYESSKNVSHMPGFEDRVENDVAVRKVILGKKKAEVKPQTHIKVKNAVFLNKAIRKLKARSGLKVKFTDVLNRKVEDLRVVIHCDAGSIETIEKSKSQIGVIAMIQSRETKVIYPEDNFRLPDVKGARKAVKNQPYIKSVPIFWTSGKSERVAVSSFAAELQAIYCAFDAGTVLRQLYSELICGHSAGFIPVEIRNDQISVVNALNGMSAIPTDSKTCRRDEMY